MESAKLDLEAVPVRVVNLNFDGLGRTKSDFVAGSVKEIFQVKTFGELMLRVGQAQDKLRKLETFKEVSAIIDVSKTSEGDYKAGDGYDITFVVQEFGRVAASAKTQMGSQADAQVKTGLRMPNLFGRGERLEMEYSYSSGEERNTELSFMKPFPTFLDSSIRSSLFSSKTPNVHANYINTAVGSLLTYSFSTHIKNLSFHNKLEWEATWREIMPASMGTPFSIRLQCGNSFKSALRYLFTFESRDRVVFPSQGTFANVLQELAGIGGDVLYHKMDIDLQHNIPLPLNMTSFRAGILTSADNDRSCGIADKFFLGGPSSLRGFSLRGINVGPDGLSLGGKAHWSTAVHLFTPFPALNRKFPMVDNCRLHFFMNAGNLADKFLARDIIKGVRIAYGVGIAIGLADFAKIEVNYCWPVKCLSDDKAVKGLQIGVGIHFL